MNKRLLAILMTLVMCLALMSVIALAEPNPDKEHNPSEGSKPTSDEDYEEEVYVIRASAQGGSTSPSGRVEVKDGHSRTFTFTPDSGYTLTDVIVDGESIGVADSYTFRFVEDDHTIEAIFTKNPSTGANA